MNESLNNTNKRKAQNEENGKASTKVQQFYF